MGRVKIDNYLTDEQSPDTESSEDFETKSILTSLRLQLDLVETNISQEGMFKDVAKRVYKKKKEFIEDLVKDSEVIIKKYQDRLAKHIATANGIKNKNRTDISGLKGLIFDESKGEFNTDILAVIGKDIEFLKSMISLLGEIDKTWDHNLSFMDDLKKAKDKESFKEIVEDKNKTKIITIATVLEKRKMKPSGFSNTKVVKTKENVETSSLRLYRSSGDYSFKDKFKTNFNPYMTGKEIAKIFEALDEFCELSVEIVHLLKTFYDKYDPRKGVVSKKMISAEKEILKNVNLATYMLGIEHLATVNNSFYKTVKSLPSKVASRNITVLQKFDSFGEKLK